MPYQINRFNGVQLVTLEDGTLDQTTDLKLVGKNYAGYGEVQNENYVFLLESFSNTTAPPKPLSGQIWYDSSTKKLKFYDASKWRTTGGAEIGPTAPTGLTTGDFWFNTTTNQLYAWNGISAAGIANQNNAGFVLVGPQAVSGPGTTELLSRTVNDQTGTPHDIIQALVSGDTIFIISTDNFTLDGTTNAITGFSIIKSGITLVNSSTGSTSTAHRLFGTASDTDKLGGYTANSYVLKAAPYFSVLATFADAGFAVGNDGDIAVYVDGGTTATIKNTQNNSLTFKVVDGVTERTPLKLVSQTVVPGITDTIDLGTQTLEWNNVWGKTFHGTDFYGGTFHGTFIGGSDKADTLLFNAGYRSADNTNVGNTIVARDVNGSFAANIVTATATQARYADLAEKYEADATYEPGTVVIFGGEKEITVTTIAADSRVAGVISTDPAYIMNSNLANGALVALRGKIPCKVIGVVNKGDILVSSSTPGYAEAISNNLERGPAHPIIFAAAIIGKSLENKTDPGQGTIMVVV